MNVRRFFIFVLFFPCILYAQGVGIGTRIDLTSKLSLTSGQFAQLFIPDYYVRPVNDSIILVFHFHSASWAAEDQIYKARANAILFNIHLGSLSSPYQNYFTTQTNFQKILDTCLSVIKTNGIMANPKIKKLILTSFSAGYAGLREILKSPAYYDKIDVINLADGLHSNSDPGTMAVQMKDFLQFAKDSRDKKKIMIMTHSSIPTSGYQSTTQTANYLISGIGSTRVTYSSFDGIGNQTSKCDTGSFRLKGYTGQTADDHMKHLYAMNKMLEQAINIMNSTSTDVRDNIVSENSFKLYQNYPNPFNSTTTIKFTIPTPLSPPFAKGGKQGGSVVTLKVYDILGREVVIRHWRMDEEKSPGEYEVQFTIRQLTDDSRLSNAVYFYRMIAGEYSETKKMIYIK
ncbi:MAG: T9SS type A sorting domain-containing protein [Bacteroidetes bacterium]|nr:T9SS type A sorting domain-containing protein [Bacteroidota bacterium]MBU2585566.1 T9SS type A sorting domain-containing protein [Bacteroidota bacterium]